MVLGGLKFHEISHNNAESTYGIYVWNYHHHHHGMFFSVEGITRPKNGDFNELRLEEATNQANNHLFRLNVWRFIDFVAINIFEQETSRNKLRREKHALEIPKESVLGPRSVLT